MGSEEPGTSKRLRNPYQRGIRQYHKCRYDRAVRFLAQAEKQKGLTAVIARYYRALSHRAIGLQAMEAGRFNEAERHLRTAADCLGREGDLAGFLARLYARTGRLADCSRETDKALACRSDDARAWLAHAQALWRSGRREEAQLTLRSALRRCGEDAGLLVLLGLFLAAQGRVAEARGQFLRATHADGTSVEAHHFLGLAAAAMTDCRQAVRSLQRAFELRPNDLLLAHRLAMAARAAARQGHEVSIRLPETALAQNGTQMGSLARYITAEVDFVDAFLSLPVSEIDGQLFGVLAGALETALGDHPQYADLRHRASEVYRRLGQTAKALEHARAAVAINGGYVQARLQLARLCAESGAAAEAIEHAEQAIARGGDWPDAHCLAGELLVRAGRNDEARHHLERALKLNAGLSRAAETLASLAA